MMKDFKVVDKEQIQKILDELRNIFEAESISIRPKGYCLGPKVNYIIEINGGVCIAQMKEE